MLHNNLSINEKGNLAISGFDTVELANKYGTPLYVLDTDYVLNSCLKYKNLIEKYFGEGSKPLFASKALSCMEIYRIAKKAGIGIDVVSGGEIYTANKAGFPMENAYFHGNNKTDADIKFALDSGVGCFVVDIIDIFILLLSIKWLNSLMNLGKVVKWPGQMFCDLALDACFMNWFGYDLKRLFNQVLCTWSIFVI